MSASGWSREIILSALSIASSSRAGPFKQFLRHEHVSYRNLSIDFREERWAGFLGQFGTPVCFFTIPVYLPH
jgi:hypothetical protein